MRPRTLLFPAFLHLLAGALGCRGVTVESSATGGSGGGGAGPGGAGGTGASPGGGGAGTTGVGGAECVPEDDQNPCTEDLCVDGSPAHPAKPDGAACDDGDACTPGDTCQSGACQSGPPLACPAGTSCSGGACLAPVCTGAIGLPALPFVQITEAPGAVAVADFDGDGAVDIAVAGAGVSVALNRGHGTFTTPVVLDAGSLGFGSVLAPDLDGDGAPDLLVRAADAGGQVRALFNVGGGAFTDPVDLFAITGGIGGGGELATADFDGDGSIDIASTESGGASLFLNHGDGTFAAPIAYAALQGASAVVAADFDGDGTMDIAADRTGRVDVLLNLGGGVLAAPVSNPVAVQPLQLAAADLDGDGAPDLAVVMGADGDPQEIVVMLNAGNGTLAVASYHAFPCGPTPIVAADLDGDGDVDLACGAGGARILHNLGGGAFADQVVYPTGSSITAVAAADVGEDGAVDLVVVNRHGLDVGILHNQGGGAFAVPGPAYATGANYGSIALGDLDGDGRPDVVAGSAADGVSVLIEQSDGTLAAPVDYPVASNGGAVVTGDFDGDGSRDVAVARLGDAASMSVLFNDGSGALSLPVDVAGGPVPYGAQAMAAGDLDGDGDADLVALRADAGLFVVLSEGGGAFAAPATYGVDHIYRELATGDLDGDGDLDLAATLPDEGQVSVFFNEGKGTFAAPETSPAVGVVTSYLLPVTAADLDGDGRADLAFADNATGEVSVILNQGGGTFGAPKAYPAIHAGIGITAVDLDNDGDADLVVPSIDAGDNVCVLFNHGDGTFEEPLFYAHEHSLYSKSLSAQAVAAGDLDGDGRMDLAVAGAGVDVMAGACLP